jgi:hypothetical protein
MEYLAMFVSLPSRQGAGRMRIWRGLRALGCAALRDGVYLLPETPSHATALAAIADEVVHAGGTADIYRLSGRDARQQAELPALFERGDEYAALLKAAAAAAPDDEKALRALRRDLARIAAIDFFPGEAQRQARAALAALEAASGGEPMARNGAIRRLASADYQGRTWATRKKLWVDRMASAWLIRRFIDPQGRIPFGWTIRRNARRPRWASISTARPSPMSAGASASRCSPPVSASTPTPRWRGSPRSCIASMSAACRWPRRPASKPCWPACARHRPTTTTNCSPLPRAFSTASITTTNRSPW